jgi:hypothetical protein
MKIRWSGAAATLLWLRLTSVPMTAADDAGDAATLLRVFMRDGTSLVSYGEFAHVGDRVIFSMPMAASANPPLQLVNIPADRVNWERTNRYADSARAARYAATSAENDYAVLSNAVSRTLNDVALADPAKRLAIIEGARKTLAEWPASHFNYRASEVRQMLTLLDEAIADLRVSTGGTRFDLSEVAVAEPPASSERLLPPPTPIESIEGLLTAAKMTGSATERQTLLDAAIGRLDSDAALLPHDWAAATRAKTQTALDAERRVDGSYRTLVRRLTRLADARAQTADVNGVRRLIVSLRRNDVVLGQQRPEVVNAAIEAIESRLDAARRLRLARDRWAARLPALRDYRLSIATSLAIFRAIEGPLADIKELSGSTQATLRTVQREVARALRSMEQIMPPEEGLTAHGLLVSAAHLANNAARLRIEATASGDIGRAWDASSAAAGALMLSTKARMDIQSFLRPPQLQ